MKKTLHITLASITFLFVFAIFAVVSTNTVAAFGSSGGSGGGSGSGSDSGCGSCGSTPTPTPTPTPDPDPVPPVCNYLRADKMSLPVGGGNVILTWSSSRGTSATITPDGSAVALNSSKSVNVTNDTTFVFRVTNSDGSDTCQVRVEVEDMVAPKCDYLRATPTSLPYGGGNVALSWETTGATKVTLVGYGEVAADGSRTVAITDDTTFRLLVENAAGSAECTKTVPVDEPEHAPKCDYLRATPTSLPYGGGNVTLSWETTNATAVSINNGIGDVALDGSRTVSVNQTTTFTLTAAKAGQSNDTCTVTITVGTPSTLSCAENVRFTANDYSLPYGGGNVTLSWDTNGLDAITITDVSNPAFDGSATVNVNDDKTYTLTATKDGRSVSCPLTIDVASKGGGGGGSSSPKCTLKVSDDEIKRGQEITLSWTTSKLDEVVIKDNHGNVLVDGDDKDDLDGSMKIRPTKDTTFTLVGEKGSRSKTCKVEVEVEEGVSVTETRNQLPLVAGISLTQVPYTGFEAGPMLTTIFYALLTIWGLFVAYIVAVRRDMIGGVSLAGAHDHVAYTDASSDVQTEVSPAAQYVAAVTTPDVPANLPTGIAPVVGYAAVQMTEEETDASIEMTELENRAHAQKALFSSDAMRYFTKVTAADERFAALDQLIAKAKAAFPSEDGWLVVNLARLESLLETNTAAATVAAEVTPGNGGSLAEAIVTGNIVAAYQLIAHRPMIALADAAAELDAVVRARRGEVISLSTMLADESARLTDAQLADAIKALTSAIDGVYTSEEEAVKMAIMKAVKATV